MRFFCDHKRLCVLIALAVAVQIGVANAEKGVVPDDFQSPENGGPRRWETNAADVVLFSEPTPTAAPLLTLAPHSVLTNLGCHTSSDQIWCKLRPLRSAVTGYIPATQLTPAQGPDGQVPTGHDDSMKRANKRDFDAKGNALCAQEQGQELGPCAVAVSRGSGGDATVVVTFPNGFARRLSFVHGEFMRGSATMSGVGTDMEWREDNGVYHIRVDDQRFELPISFVLGD